MSRLALKLALVVALGLFLASGGRAATTTTTPPADGGAALAPPPPPSGGSSGAGSATTPTPAAGTEAKPGSPGTTAGSHGPTGGSRRAASPSVRTDFSERYLRGLVKRSRACLSSLAPVDSRALRLRTGIGAERRYAPAEVARMLGVSLAREAQIEHHAVGALKRAARAGECGSTRTAQTPSSPSTVQSAVTTAPPVIPTTSLPGSARPGVHREPAKPRRVKPSHAVKAASARIPLPFPGPSSGSGPALFVVLALVGAVMVLVVTVVRRGMLRPVAAGVRLPNWQLSALSYQRHEASALLPAPTNASEAEVNAYERLYDFEDPAAASDLGVLLANQGDLAGALAAFRRADERGDPAAASNLGVLLAERGDAAGALAAFHRADERGDAEGASNLGVLLERQGDLEAALAAYRRADQRGDAEGSFNLGSLLAERGDVAGAIDAYRRARWRGDTELAEASRQALVRLTGR